MLEQDKRKYAAASILNHDPASTGLLRRIYPVTGLLILAALAIRLMVGVPHPMVVTCALLLAFLLMAAPLSTRSRLLSRYSDYIGMYALLALLVICGWYSGGIAAPGMVGLPIIPMFALFTRRNTTVKVGVVLALLVPMAFVLMPIIGVQPHATTAAPAQADLARGGIIGLVCIFFVISVYYHSKYLHERQQLLGDLSRKDYLTGLTNRMHFDLALEKELRRAARNGAPLSLLLLDCDHFKTLNDSYGHQVGDDYLVSLSDVLTRTLRRAGDMVARYGGEEFAILLPDTGFNAAMQVAASLQNAVREAPIAHAPGTSKVTVSIGLTTTTVPVEITSRELVRQADDALYRAKRQGRNRTVAYADQIFPNDPAPAADQA
ncbi:MAG: GGDEF domain-containing protein [Gammaproteobacteria bacterium]|nr:GGDEF domain-containing protein [Gammaproteobacteria bacterium]